jgi:hypothetical protein
VNLEIILRDFLVNILRSPLLPFRRSTASARRIHERNRPRTFTITPFRSRQYAIYRKRKSAKIVSFRIGIVKHWCAAHGLELTTVRPFHVAAWIEDFPGSEPTIQ